MWVLVGGLAGEHRNSFGFRTPRALACLVRPTDAAPCVCKGCGCRSAAAHARWVSEGSASLRVRVRFRSASDPGNAADLSTLDAPLAAPLTRCYAGLPVAWGNLERPPSQPGAQARPGRWLAAGTREVAWVQSGLNLHLASWTPCLRDSQVLLNLQFMLSSSI